MSILRNFTRIWQGYDDTLSAENGYTLPYLCDSNFVYTNDNDELMELVALLPSLHQMSRFCHLVKGINEGVSAKVIS